jgi:hypothetical protein
MNFVSIGGLGFSDVFEELIVLLRLNFLFVSGPNCLNKIKSFIVQVNWERQKVGVSLNGLN